MAEFLRRARPRGLAKAASSRERSWRIGWTRMTLTSLDSYTDPATMVTSRQVRAQDRPARYSVPAKVIVGTTADVKHQLWVAS